MPDFNELVLELEWSTQVNMHCKNRPSPWLLSWDDILTVTSLLREPAYQGGIFPPSFVRKHLLPFSPLWAPLHRIKRGVRCVKPWTVMCTQNSRSTQSIDSIQSTRSTLKYQFDSTFSSSIDRFDQFRGIVHDCLPKYGDCVSKWPTHFEQCWNCFPYQPVSQLVSELVMFKVFSTQVEVLVQFLWCFAVQICTTTISNPSFAPVNEKARIHLYYNDHIKVFKI